MAQRIHFAARSLNPPTLKSGAACCVSGPSYWQAMGPEDKRPSRYNNHGKVISFDAMLDTYIVQLIGIPSLLPSKHPSIKVKSEYVYPRNYDDPKMDFTSDEFSNIRPIYTDLIL